MGKIVTFFCAALVLLLFAGVLQDMDAAEPTREASGRDDPWIDLQQRNPYPYTLPLPADNPTEIDGVYVKFETRATPPIPCRRCPDYKPEGGWWKLSLRRGVFRIFHEATGWKSLGSFLLIGDRLLLANDPVCPQLNGMYRWQLTDGNLSVAVIEDRCSAGLRAKNLAGLVWQSCMPPTHEAAVTGHWPIPTGCGQP